MLLSIVIPVYSEAESLATLHAGSDTGPELQLLPLPYVLLEDI